MRTINNIPPKEDLQRLTDACTRVRRYLTGKMWEAETRVKKAWDADDEVEYLKWTYWDRALRMAIDAVTKSPEQLRRK